MNGVLPSAIKTFCAQPLMKHLPNTDQDFVCGAKSENTAGAVQASLGVHNTEKEIEILAQAIRPHAKKAMERRV
jgi:selenocysteine lyase/cysteine desulfurase